MSVKKIFQVNKSLYCKILQIFTPLINDVLFSDSESSMLFWDQAEEHTAFSPNHPALSGGFTRVFCPAGADI